MTRGNAEYTIAIQRAASSYTSCYERLMPIYTLMAYFVLFGGGGVGNGADAVRNLNIQSHDCK